MKRVWWCLSVAVLLLVASVGMAVFQVMSVWMVLVFAGVSGVLLIVSAVWWRDVLDSRRG